MNPLYALASSLTDTELDDCMDLLQGARTGIRENPVPSATAAIRLIDHLVDVVTTARHDPDRTTNQN